MTNAYSASPVVFIEHTENIPEHDPVNHPSHYTSHPSGVECIEITRHMDFNTGNAMKYLWRAGLKDSVLKDARSKDSVLKDSANSSKLQSTIQDLEKAIFYINDRIAMLQAEEYNRNQRAY